MDAARAAVRARTVARALGLRMPTVASDRAAAFMALATGDARSAADMAMAAAATAEEVEAPIEAAVAHQLADARWRPAATVPRP